MGFMDIFKSKKSDAGQQTGDFPKNFLKLIGHEKVYGIDHQMPMEQMIKEYRSWVYACANRNAYSVAKLELKLMKEVLSKDGVEQEEITDHVFLDLMKNVNPFFNKFELMTLTTVFLELTGNAYWWIAKNPLGVPIAIWNIPANWVKVIPSEKDFIAGYAIQPPRAPVPIPFNESEIIHFKYPSPFSIFYGASPTMAAQFGIDLNNQMKVWQINFFMNNAQPSGILTTDNSLSEAQFMRLKDQWNAKYKGSGNAGKMALLEKGLKYQQTGSMLKDMDAHGTNKDIRDEILAVMGVPASKLGLVEDVNRANADANDYTYQKETILPKLILIKEKINEKLMPMYDSGLVLDFEDPVPADKEFRLREKEINIRSGYSAIDDEREKDDEERYELPETVVPLIPFSLKPAGEVEPEPEPIIPPPTGKPEVEATSPKKIMLPSEIKSRRKDNKWNMFAHSVDPQINHMARTMKSFFQAQQAEVLGNINKYKGIQQKKVDANIMFNMQQEVNRLSVDVNPFITESFKLGSALAAEELGGIDFELVPPHIKRSVDARIGFFAEQVNDTTFKMITQEINAGIASGESIDDIAKRIDRVYAFRIKHSARLTAQTETIGAVNEAQITTYMEAEVEEKEWLTAHDERVRNSHTIDGQVQKTGEAFWTNDGYPLLFPGDRSTGAPAGEVINCRCTVIPKID